MLDQCRSFPSLKANRTAGTTVTGNENQPAGSISSTGVSPCDRVRGTQPTSSLPAGYALPPLTLFAAELATQLLYATALWLTAVAFGFTLPFASVLLINTLASLLAGILPIPGGVGITEAIPTAGLTAISVDESAAFAIAVTYRVISAYLPPVWGWLSLQWLQRNDYL